MATKPVTGQEWVPYSSRTNWDHADIDRTQLTNAGKTARMRCVQGTYFVEVLPEPALPPIRWVKKPKKRCRQSGLAQKRK